MSKLLVVTGATGLQGGSVVSAVLDDEALSSVWKIRATTRDTSKPAAQVLKNKGVEIVKADFDDATSMRAAFRGAHAVFGTTNYWEYFNKYHETAQGNTMVDAAKEEGVKHFIWSSLINAEKATNGKLSNIWHFDGKAATETHLITSGLSWTCFYAGMYMKNWLLRDFLKLLKIYKNKDGAFEFTLPCKSDALFPLYDVGDTGLYVIPILRDLEGYESRRVYSGTYMTGQDIVDTVSRVCGNSGKGVINVVPKEEFMRTKFPQNIPEIVSKELTEQMLLLNRDMPGYYAGEELDSHMDNTEKITGKKLMTWSDFVEKNKEIFIENGEKYSVH